MERFNKSLVTNLKNNEISPESVRIVMDDDNFVDAEKLDKSLLEIGKSIKAVRVDLASDLKRSNRESGNIMEIIAKKCTI